MSTLELADLTAGYGQLPIVRGVSMRADAGKIVSVLGANGSGKSTLLKAIIGLLKPTNGRVTLVGQELTGLQPYQIVQAGIGYVPQTSNVFVSLNVVENLEMGAFVRKGNIRSSIDRILESFPDLRAAQKKRAGDLSVGQRNLLGLARALNARPKGDTGRRADRRPGASQYGANLATARVNRGVWHSGSRCRAKCGYGRRELGLVLRTRVWTNSHGLCRQCCTAG